MSFAAAVARELLNGGSPRSASPEFRRIEFGTRRPVLNFADPEPFDRATVAEVAAVVRADAVLRSVLDGGQAWDIGSSSWERYARHPRATRAERVAGELVRRLRLVSAIALREGARAERRDALVYLGVDVGKEIYEIEITSAGLALLELAAHKLIEFRDTIYPEAWVEAYLMTLAGDITAEIAAFHDEDNVPQQFRPSIPFNRHARFDCENPRSRIVDGGLEIEIPEAYKNVAVFAIDFHTVVDEHPCVIPAEALENGRMPLSEVPRWRARTNADGAYPDRFRRRFAHGSRADPVSKRL